VLEGSVPIRALVHPQRNREKEEEGPLTSQDTAVGEAAPASAVVVAAAAGGGRGLVGRGFKVVRWQPYAGGRSSGG
jgi:hypothetical protein